jgi:hypothetical protein
MVGIGPAHFDFDLGVAQDRIVWVEFRRKRASAFMKRTP